MKTSIKNRVWSLILSVLMIVTMIPMVAMPASAAGSLANALTVPDLGADWTDASNSSGAASWTGSGTTITGTAKGYKTAGIFNSSVNTKLTLTNKKSGEAILSFKYTLTNGGSVTASTGTMSSGTYTGTLAAGASTVITLTSPKGTSTNTLTITNLSLLLNATGDINTTFMPSAGGTFTVDGTAVSAETVKVDAVGAKYTLAATASSGYKFVGWYQENGSNGKYISFTASTTIEVDSNTTVYPVFVSGNTPIFQVGTDYFYDLDDAVNFAVSGSTKQITLISSGTISDAAYEIPAGITLLIPYSADYTPKGEKPVTVSDKSYTPKAYVTLTLGANTAITVNGTVEVGATFRYISGGNTYGGCPKEYGAINMSAGSSIELNNGAKLFAWGYIYGNGSVTANNGAKVYESMQITDFYGGGNLGDMQHMFPFSQYYVQNIEVPLTLEYGATEYMYVKLVISSYELPALIAFISNSGDAMFSMKAGTSVTKEYDPATDRMIIGIDGDASLQSVALEPDLSGFDSLTQLTITGVLSSMMGGTTINSANYILNLNGNMTINITSGTTTISQEMSVLPGAEINVAEGAVLKIASGDSSKTTVSEGSAGKNVYLFDSEQWDAYVFSSKKLIPAIYSPTQGRYKRTEADLTDVVLDINGTVITDGYLYTTVNYEYEFDEETGELISLTIVGGGASVISSEGTGKLIMNNGAGSEMGVYNLDGKGATETTIFAASAQLQNADGTYYDTTGAVAGSEFEYCTAHGCWFLGTCEQCKVTYEITWVVNDEEPITLELEAGTTPVYPGETPTKDPDASKHYTFAGWATSENGAVLETIPAVTGAATYYAVFTAEVHADTDKVAVDGKHYCDACGTLMYSCENMNYDKDHVCDYGCGEVMGDCKDKTNDHKCDVCGEEISSCADGDTDHACDVCGAPMGTHEAAEGKHTCDYCGAAVSNCADGDTDHDCDVCGAEMGTHEAAEGKHTCDYCGAAVSNCTDDNTDHACDVCGAEMGTHEAAEGTHVCEYCGKAASVCADSDTDHACDVCGAEMGEHKSNAAYPCLAGTCDYCKAAMPATADHIPGEDDGNCTTAITCTVCGTATTEAKEAHTATKVEALAPSCAENGNVEHWICSECGMYFLDEACTNVTNATDVVLGATCATNAIHSEPVEAGCHYAGKLEYWYCANCDVYYLDAACTIVTSRKNLNIPALQSTADYVPALEGTCKTEGHVEYWTCDECEQVWADEALTQLTTLNDVGTGYDPSNHEAAPSYSYTTIDGIAKHIKEWSCCNHSQSAEHSFSEANNGICECGMTYVAYGSFTGGYGYDYVKVGTEYTLKTPAEALKTHNTWPGYDTYWMYEYWNDENGEKPADILITEANDEPYSGDKLTITHSIVLRIKKVAHTDTPYKVEHWLHRVDAENALVNDAWRERNYELVDTEYLTGTTDTVINVSENEYEGFSLSTKVGTDKSTTNPTKGQYIINGNGETVYRIYYSRNTYTVTWEVDGEVYETTEVKYGAEPIAPAYDVPAGYEFSGWAAPETMPAEDITLDATLTAKTYTVTWTVNGEEYTTTEVKYGETPIAPEYDVPAGYEFSGWFVPGTMPAEDITLDATIEALVYTVTWTVNDEVYETTEVKYGAEISAPDYETPEGHTFSGWDVPETMPAKDITLDATLTVNTYMLTVLDWHSEKITICDPVEIPYGASIIDYLNEVDVKDIIKDTDTANGVYKFTGTWMCWVDDESFDVDESIKMPAEDFTVFALFTYTGWTSVTVEGELGYHIEGIPQTGWFEIDENWYYLNPENNGARAEGITRVPYPTVVIKGVEYKCTEAGADETFIDYSSALFVFDDEGKLLYGENGQISDGEKERYVVDGMIPWNYGLTFVPCIDSNGNNYNDYYYYIGDEEDGGNMLATGDVYMIRTNGYTLDGKAPVVGGVYTFAEIGSLLKYEGITEVNGVLRYYSDYCFTAKSGLIKVMADGAEKYIYVRSSTSQLVVNTNYYVAGNGIVTGFYDFDENGYMINPISSDKNGVFFEDGAYYYYEGGVKAYAGLIKYTGTANDGTVYDDDYIYVRSNGQLAVGRYWIAKNNGLLDAKIYDFNDKGIMDIRDGIVAENGSLYYYVDGILAEGAGLIKIGENYYYVRSSGEVVNGRSYWIANTNGYEVLAKTYDFDENGVMLDVEIKNTGLNGVVDGYYYEDGQIVYGAGPIEWEGNIYYVRSNGMVATGKYWTTASNEILPAGRYEFAEDGKLIK